MKVDRRVALTGLAASLLGACTSPVDLAKTRKPAKGGIGGTGIVGTLTGFGSVLVNGLRVELDGAAITDAFGPLEADALQVGHSLTIEAATQGDDLAARRVHVTQPVIGMVLGAAPDGRLGRVAGVPVQLEDGAIGRLRMGDRVAVSGIWSRGMVIGTRVDPARSALSVIAGVHASGPDDATPRIGRVRLDLGDQTAPEPGTFSTLTGRFANGRFQVQTVVPGRFTGAAGALSGLSVEGYLTDTPEAPFKTVEGLGHSFDAAAQLDQFTGQRMLFSGGYADAFAVENGVVLPENLSGRRTLLNGIADGTLRPLALSAR